MELPKEHSNKWTIEFIAMCQEDRMQFTEGVSTDDDALSQIQLGNMVCQLHYKEIPLNTD